jgi:hypothetical protein
MSVPSLVLPRFICSVCFTFFVSNSLSTFMHTHSQKESLFYLPLHCAYAHTSVKCFQVLTIFAFLSTVIFALFANKRIRIFQVYGMRSFEFVA